MSNPNTKWYLDFIERELDKLNEGKFIGNVNFKINLKDGDIKNMNVTLNKFVSNFSISK